MYAYRFWWGHGVVFSAWDFRPEGQWFKAWSPPLCFSVSFKTRNITPTIFLHLGVLVIRDDILLEVTLHVYNGLDSNGE